MCVWSIIGKEHNMPSDVSSSTTKQFHIHKNTDNKDNNKLFMILYNCNFMMYFMLFHTGFLFGRGVGLRVYFTRFGIFSFITGRLCSCCLICVLFTIGLVTAYTSGPSSTFWLKKKKFFENLKLFNKPQPTFKPQNSMKYIYIYIYIYS